jgi:hypothetical protein
MTASRTSTGTPAENMSVSAVRPRLGLLTQNCPGQTSTLYRRIVKQRFNRRSYRRQWQLEAVRSMTRSILSVTNPLPGCIVYARRYHAPCRESTLPALSYNFTVILFLHLPKSFSTEHKLLK